MNVESKPEQNQNFEHWENTLYSFLALLEEDKNEVTAMANDMYTQIQAGLKSRPNLHQMEVLNKREKEYWNLQETINATSEQIKKIEESLMLMESGKLSESELKQLIDSLMPSTLEGEEETKLSKKKRAILRDQEFNEKHKQQGVTDDFNFDYYAKTAHNPNHLTTGRHLNKVKNLGSVSVEDAEATFFYYTADTHGGKVGHGKERYKHKTKGGKSSVKGRIKK